MFLKSAILVALSGAVLGGIFPEYRQQQAVLALSRSSPDGSYEYSFQSPDGTYQEHHGGLKNLSPYPGNTASGSYSWIDPEGYQHEVHYVADENGFQPQSADLPTPPPIPEAILRSLQYIAAHPPQTRSTFAG
ncbi:endocuticle structural glycoprotein SgAbd-3-like [Anthonomus grandis grandis]|uniref:endocuticle structural glycoprotein SgAbd-3-like n=1 Tax=Anthonomus grandis grandis TaxID=2921223 RepID=UPI0021660335|nr:endocuticle structural glycoprotein SgAbd-3-like [Anthonomus grandis grandis]